METLQILEQKITQLIALVKELQAQIQVYKAENATLVRENADLILEFDSLKTSILTDQVVFAEEKALAKLAVDEIIKNIDSLVSNQDQL